MRGCLALPPCAPRSPPLCRCHYRCRRCCHGYRHGIAAAAMACPNVVRAAADSKTLMVVQASPVAFNAEETYSSLNFAARVRAVELGQVRSAARARRDAATDTHDWLSGRVQAVRHVERG